MKMAKKCVLLLLWLFRERCGGMKHTVQKYADWREKQPQCTAWHPAARG